MSNDVEILYFEWQNENTLVSKGRIISLTFVIDILSEVGIPLIRIAN